MMHPERLCRAALYARVSSDQQAEAGTIGSQVAALEERMRQDGVSVDPELCFIDDGYSGSTLVRPGLERLRDAASNGAVEHLYVHAPDRLARSYVHQVLLVDELKRCGVTLMFLNRAVGETPEDQLLLQVQGVVAEYERAKILERSRRGRLHAARQGKISVLAGSAPYGYRYVSKQEGGGQARYEVVWDQAQIVRQLFSWVGEDRLTIGEAARRLTQQGGADTHRQRALGSLDGLGNSPEPGIQGPGRLRQDTSWATAATAATSAWPARAAAPALLTL